MSSWGAGAFFLDKGESDGRSGGQKWSTNLTEDYIEKMDVCRHLLPPPGDEVVGECIAEIRRLRAITTDRAREEKAAMSDSTEAASVGVDTLVRRPAGMYGEPPAVRIGSFTLSRQGLSGIWIQCDDGEGGQFDEKAMAACIEEFYQGNF